MRGKMAGSDARRFSPRPRPAPITRLDAVPARKRRRTPAEYAKSHASEERVFNAICDYKRLNDGNSPSVRELQSFLDFSSTSVVQYYIVRLISSGRIRLHRGSTRGINVAGGQWTFKAPDATE